MDLVSELVPVPDSAATGNLERKAILVLGMHRSGTSALSGVMHLLGVKAPEHIQPGNEFNEKGYWESQPIVRLNERILHAAGSKWSDWTAFDESRLSPEDRSRFDSEVEEVIAAEYGDARLIVLKDPRLCRILAFWLRGLDRAGIVPKVVLPIRNPLESALSLLHRDNIAVQEGLLLWLRHVLDAERLTRGRDRCFVSFDELLADWRSATARVSSMLAIAWPNPLSEAGAAINDFLSRELRHHGRSYRDLEIHADIFDWVLAAYESLLKLGSAADTERQILDRLDEIYRAFDQASRAFGTLVQYKDEQIAAGAKEMVELRRRLEAAGQAHAHAQAAAVQLHEEAKDHPPGGRGKGGIRADRGSERQQRRGRARPHGAGPRTGRLSSRPRRGARQPLGA
jgi:hypothetical protein